MTDQDGWFAQGVPAIWPGIPRGFVLCAQAGVLWPTGVELSTPTMLVMTKKN